MENATGYYNQCVYRHLRLISLLISRKLLEKSGAPRRKHAARSDPTEIWLEASPPMQSVDFVGEMDPQNKFRGFFVLLQLFCAGEACKLEVFEFLATNRALTCPA